MTDTDYNAQEYKDLLKEASRDTRVGDHDWVVQTVINDLWPSGDPRLKLNGVLSTANSAKADLTLSPPPSPEEVKANKGSWDQPKVRAIATSIQIHQQLAKHYGKKPADVQEGDVFRVKTALTKRNPDGSGGFVRIIAFLDPKGVGSNGSSGTRSGAEVPF